MNHFIPIISPSAMATAFCEPSSLSLTSQRSLCPVIILYGLLVLFAVVVWLMFAVDRDASVVSFSVFSDGLCSEIYDLWLRSISSEKVRRTPTHFRHLLIDNIQCNVSIWDLIPTSDNKWNRANDCQSLFMHNQQE